MSGFVVAYGKTDRQELEAMFKRIRHRGPFANGIFETNQTIMAQNYLEADGAPRNQRIEIPVLSLSCSDLRICYDGQIGNCETQALAHGISDGPLRDERLLLLLYQAYGKEMLHHLNDAIFAFVISDGDELFAARDLLGIKTLYYGWKNRTLYLASELKSLIEITGEVYEFPPGHYMDQNGQLLQFAALPETPPALLSSSPDTMIEDIRRIIIGSLHSRVSVDENTGSLLSGGIDSSVIAFLASEVLREQKGTETRLKTFAIGLGESSDIQNARIMAALMNSDHHELIVNLEQALEVLPEVIYYLESFDPSLVRSAIANFLISRYAHDQGIKVLLSGEGGDEIFCGYTYLKEFPLQEMFNRQMECLGFLHNNAALRLDRMNQCHNLRVVTPLISGELLKYAMAIPPEYKQKPEGNQRIEKWIFRKAYESFLPERVVWRLKQEFSQGSGFASTLPSYFESEISDDQLIEAKAEYPFIRSKEELHYFSIFIGQFPSELAIKTVGQWIYL